MLTPGRLLVKCLDYDKWEADHFTERDGSSLTKDKRLWSVLFASKLERLLSLEMKSMQCRVGTI